MMKNLRKALSLLLTIAIAMCSFVLPANAESEAIFIDNAEDLVQLANDCKLDISSQGKQYVLTADIDLSGVDFVSIPTFGGTFDGGNYTISGLDMRTEGTNLGIFRYVQKTGVVKNLNVSAIYAPQGTKQYIGGIVGSNSGRIVNCSFAGSINADSYIGGIAGQNTSTGMISGCTSSGLMLGITYTGGICGYNEGTIINSKNTGSVNISESEEKLNIADIDIDSITSTAPTDESTVSGQSDTGGICGYSEGIIQGCENSGEIGYQHVGYNVGGIVGRQCGYVNNCTNYGEVYGRKDCGGIVGQMEPYRSIEFSDDMLAQLGDEADKLKEAVNKLIDDAKGTNTNITGETGTLIDQLNATKDYADTITGKTEDIFNGYTDSINEISARASDTIDKLAPVTDKLSEISDKFTVFCNQLRTALDLMSASGEYTSEALDSAYKAMDRVDDSVKYIEQGLDDASNALSLLRSSMGDTTKVKTALTNLISSFGTIAKAGKTISTGLSDIKTAMDSVEDWVNNSEDWKNLDKGLGELSDCTVEISDALSKMNTAIKRIIDSTDPDEIDKALSDLADGVKSLNNASDHFAKAMEAASSTPSDLDTMYDELDAASDELEDATAKLETAAQHFADAVNADGSADGALDEISDALDEMNKAVENASKALQKVTEALSNIKNSDVPKNAYDKISAATDSISGAVSTISDEMVKIDDYLNTINNQINLNDVQFALGEFSDMADKINYAVKIIDSASTDVDNADESLSAAIDDLAKAGSKAGDCADTMAEMSDMLSDVFDDISDIMDGLSGDGKVIFPNIDESYTGAVDSLQSELSGMTNTLSRLNSIIRNQNEILLDDFQAVSDEVNAIINIFVDLEDNQYNASSVSDAIANYTDDISEDDNDSTIQGKVAGSANYGKVEADVNVGGVAGAMAIEYDLDPEDDITSSGNLSIRFKYYVRDVMKNCTNYGDVISKKNYCGGIVGRMDMGLVSLCKEDSHVESKSGSYAGGIAGASYAALRDNISTVSISAETYIGGIAGYGTTLTDNFAMADIVDGNEFVGAIAGDYDSEADMPSSKNYFVDRGTAGIDGISYNGIAQPASFEKFAEKCGLTEDGARLSLTFKADDEIIEVINFNYGDSISSEQIPEIPAKEGCFAKWEDFDYDMVTFSYVINAVSTDYVTAISTEAVDDREFPLVIADGLYDGDAVITVTTDGNYKLNDENALLRAITIKGNDYSGKNPTKLRFLVPDDGREYTVMQCIGGAWTETNCSDNGNYIVLESASLENGNGVFCLTSKALDMTLVIILISGGAAIIVIVLVTILAVKKRGKRKKKQAEEVKISE